MELLQEFITLLSGRFDNRAQIQEFSRQGISDFPYAQHVNTVCNDKITGLPAGFSGFFLVEESYYTVKGRTNASPHLFLFTQEGNQVQLTSYELPEGADKTSFTYETMQPVPYAHLKPSPKFTPARDETRGDFWEGGSESTFAPGLIFKLYERFSPQVLEVSESMERGGVRIFGYDQPICYRRSQP